MKVFFNSTFVGKFKFELFDIYLFKMFTAFDNQYFQLLTIEKKNNLKNLKPESIFVILFDIIPEIRAGNNTVKV